MTEIPEIFFEPDRTKLYSGKGPAMIEARKLARHLLTRGELRKKIGKAVVDYHDPAE